MGLQPTHITTHPLVGRYVIKPGNRIVVWDHLENKAFFVGKVTHMTRSGAEVIGENFVLATKVGGKLTETIRLNLQTCGVLPTGENPPRLSHQYRTYALPQLMEAARYKDFRVDYVLPENRRRIASS